MNYFTDDELKIINALVYNDSLKPVYDPVKDCLIWDDERPEGLVGRSYEKVVDLWIARSFLHRGYPREQWYGINPRSTYFADAWESALKQSSKWPGFRRLQLSPEEKTYLIDASSQKDDI